MKKIIILYVPVLHAGYLRFLEKHKNVDTLYLVGKTIAKEFNGFAKEIRQIDPEKMRVIIEACGLHHSVKILESGSIPQENITEIITADDTISLGATEKYFPNVKRRVDSIFLRWDEKNVYSQKPVSFGRISNCDFDQSVIELIQKEAEKSSDWWRHVGAAIVKDKKILLISHNQHLPSEHTSYALGDPRDFIEVGKNSELSSALHAEQALIAEAARRGVSLERTSIYVTVFPCPVCAKMIAYSGIRKVFFSSGHASFDGETILKAKGVELIFVK